MLIEIVQHESNKVVREATEEQAKEFAQRFPVFLVGLEGERTSLKFDDEIQPPADVPVLTDEVAPMVGESAEAS